MTRSTTDRFFTGRPVDFSYFVYICERLGLDWQDIIVPLVDPDEPPTAQVQVQDESLEIYTLVQQVRQQCQEKIQTLYGKMQLLLVTRHLSNCGISIQF